MSKFTNNIINGNSLEILKKIPSKSFDLMYVSTAPITKYSAAKSISSFIAFFKYNKYCSARGKI